MRPWMMIPAWYAAVGLVIVAVWMRKRREARDFAADYELLCITEGAGDRS